MHRHSENIGELAHEARNMMTALSLYCDLLEEPGVLAPSHRHYGGELRLLADASRQLVEKWGSEGFLPKVKALINIDMIGDKDLDIMNDANS